LSDEAVEVAAIEGGLAGHNVARPRHLLQRAQHQACTEKRNHQDRNHAGPQSPIEHFMHCT